MNKLKEKLQRVPNSCGVYLMKDSYSRILYVGKAKKLKARLTSYFSRSILDPKTLALVQKIEDFEVIMVSSEWEALLLERNLIKKHKPDYNVVLRDDKEYPYLRIDIQSPWPRIKKVRRISQDGAVYLGPYSQVAALSHILDLCYQIFPIIRCSEYTFRTISRPCNYYHMKRCLGPCKLPVDQTLYKEMMHSAIAFLQGKDKSVLKELGKRMKFASEHEDYENAARYRDQIQAIKSIFQQQNVVVSRIKNADAIALVTAEDVASFHVLMVRDGKVTGRSHYILDMRLPDLSKGLLDFMIQYYSRHSSPELVLIPLELDEGNLDKVIQGELSKNRVQISVPKSGQKKSLLDISMVNARYHLDEALAKQNKYQAKLLALKEKLNLSKIPRVIDCFDISNLQGLATVAAQVRFIDGKPAKDHYRLYNINDYQLAPDDYESLRIVAQRYFERLRTESIMPDLVLIDGGKGQLSSVLSVVRDSGIEICSIAKNKSSYDRVGNRIQSQERVFLADKSEAIVIAEGTPEYQLLTHIRDEAHRFAIAQHRRRRKRLVEASFLDDIRGIGPETKKRILQKLLQMDLTKEISVKDFSNSLKISEDLVREILVKFANFNL